MKTRKDFETMFEPADVGFEEAVQRGLRDVRKREATRRGGKVRTGVLIAAFFCALLAAAALAATFRWGVLDFVTGKTGGDTKVLPEATALVRDAAAVPQTGGHLPSANFSVRQAVYDGSQVYLVVAVKPRGDDALLVDHWTVPTDSVASLGTVYQGHAGSISDYAKENGKARILCAQIIDDMQNNWSATAQTGTAEADGTLAILLSGAYEGEASELSLSLPCSLAPFVQDGQGEWALNWNAEEFGILDLKITRETGTAVKKRSVAAAEFPGAGVRVDAVTLTATPMAVYYQIEYTVIDVKKYAMTGYATFAFLDKNGDILPFGAAESGGYEPEAVPEPGSPAGTRSTQRGSLNAMAVLPDSVTLAAYDTMGVGTYYGAQEIKME